MNRRQAKRDAYAVAADLVLDNADALQLALEDGAVDDPASVRLHVEAQRELAEQLAGVALRWGRRQPTPAPQLPGQLQLEPATV